MNAVSSQPAPPGDRLERFRRLMAQLDPAGDPARAFTAGQYVPSPRSASARIAARLELAPTSTHLLVGGVGSGKTTELLAVQHRLARQPDTRAIYVDVSKRHDVGLLVPGVIAVQVGLSLTDELRETDPFSTISGEAELLALAHGSSVDAFAPSIQHGAARVPGLLVPPETFRFEAAVASAGEHIGVVLAQLRPLARHIVVLIDGLDRITDMSAFESILLEDLRALTQQGIGIVLVGPLRSLYGIERTLAEHFDELHYQPWIDPADGPDASAFLRSLLRQRLAEDSLDEAALEVLCRASGGVLRDLIGLAQSACAEAYTGDSERIGVEHAASAIDSFGRKHMQGLRAKELNVLQRVRTNGSFVETSEHDLALLMTRRVLEYRTGSRPRYVVHPTIEPFLRELRPQLGRASQISDASCAVIYTQDRMTS